MRAPKKTEAQVSREFEHLAAASGWISFCKLPTNASTKGREAIFANYVNHVTARAASRGYHLALWRQNTGAVKADKRFIVFGLVGAADYSGIFLPNGRRVEIELKSPTGTQSKNQKTFQRLIDEATGVYTVGSDPAAILEELKAKLFKPIS